MGPLLAPFGRSSVRFSEESRNGSISGGSGRGQPGHDFRHAAGDGALRDGRTVDQDDRQVKVAGGGQLGLGPRTSGVLGDDDVDAVIRQKRAVAFHCEGASCDDGMGIGQGQRFGRRVNEAQEIVVLRGLGEEAKVLATDGKEDSARGIAQCGDGGIKVGDVGPVVLRSGGPGRAFKGDQGRAGFGAGGHGIRAHLRGEGMRRVDHMGDGFGLDIGLEACGAAEAAHADRQGLGDRGFGATGVGIDGVHLRLRQDAGHLSGFGRSAQKKDARHG